MATGQPPNRKLRPHQIRQGNQYNKLTIKLRIYVINPPRFLDPFVFICWQDVPHQIKLIENDIFDLIKDQIRSYKHSSKDPCIPFLPCMILCSCETQFTRKINKTLAMPSDSGPSNPFIPAFYHSWNSHLSQTSHQIAFKEQVVVFFIVAETD